MSAIPERNSLWHEGIYFQVVAIMSDSRVLSPLLRLSAVFLHIDTIPSQFLGVVERHVITPGLGQKVKFDTVIVL